jgi:predicted pyridoxine 5'-phosphate oxidase superfamily flavin-nucleotide-binding protein
MEQSIIAWHPAFIEAIQLELEEYQDSLEFHPEYQLTSEPLRIDCVIIKKAADVLIKKNIAAIFREVNLLEYKSPDDYVSVDDFYKVYGYACLFASFEKVPITSLTVSFMESRYPKKLLEHLRTTRRFTVEKSSPGIYTVKGDILPIQIIDSRKLSVEENLWLKGLSKQLDPKTVIKISDEAVKKSKAARIQAYMNAIAKANFQAVEEAMDMRSAAKSLDEVLERTGCYARAEARAEERKALEIAENMVNLGFPLEAIISATRLDPETVKAISK